MTEVKDISAIPVETVNILLDSKYGTKTSQGYTFELGHGVSLDNKEIGTCYISDFYSFHGLKNFPRDSSFQIQKGAGLITEIIIVGNQNITTLSSLATLISEQLTAQGITNVTASQIPNDYKIKFTSSDNEQFTLSDKEITTSDSLLKFLNIENNTISTAVNGETLIMSEFEVDIFAGVHNLYIAIDEISNQSRTLASGIQRNNIINRIPIIQKFGEQIVFDATTPVSEFKYTARNLNRLTITLTDDENRVYIPGRFTMSLKIHKYYKDVTTKKDKLLEEIYKNMITEKNYNHINIANDKDVPVLQELCVLPDPQKDDVTIGAVRSHKWWSGKGSIPYN